MTCDPPNPAPLPPPDLWTRARADYLAGVSAPVVAERYGLSERTLRRRAATEGWRRVDQSPVVLEPPPPWNRDTLSREEAIERFPELAEVEAAASNDAFFLLFDPDQKDLRRYAFRHAAESAAFGRPAEAVVWMRLVQMLDRTGEQTDRLGRPFREEDYLRAAYLRRLGEDVAPPPGSEPSPHEP
ncbi:hypothetical protein [uncultured Brevundimonas sp.]|uniref:hypothetical protein n=1 Tax=uncultured Brevundimonas sp. TaxID=213418 RepID=UPI0030EEFA45|tara:strand:+ start:119 stop:673 length:555 start_codon:yes stop_codon:yes gene_type:complete